MKRWNAVLALAIAALVVCVALINRKQAVPAIDKEVKADAPSPAAATGARVPVLVELFTSEGCSSCPPADELLSQLERTQPVPGAEVIVLSEHVDYWNRLGWEDPFSSAAFSARQGEYSRAFGRDGVYTPQMVVDGQIEFVGSNSTRAREAIAAAARAPKAEITVERNEAGDEARTVALRVRAEKLPPVSSGDTAEVLLAVTESKLQTSVARGENSGRRLSHTAVVRQLSVIGTTSAERSELFAASPVVTIAPNWKRVNLRAVVFIQERASRKVLGAASISLAAK